MSSVYMLEVYSIEAVDALFIADLANKVGEVISIVPHKPRHKVSVYFTSSYYARPEDLEHEFQELIVDAIDYEIERMDSPLEGSVRRDVTLFDAKSGRHALHKFEKVVFPNHI